MNAAAADVWKEFGDRLRGYIAKRLRDEHDADDVFQEVFLKIQSGLGRVENEEKLEAWLFQVTRRAIVDHFRRRRPVEKTADPEEPVPESDVSKELSACLAPMMDLLDAPDREALRLTDLEGLSQKDLAGRLGLSITGAKSRVQRARARLRETLLDCCEIELDRRGNPLGYTPRRCACNGD